MPDATSLAPPDSPCLALIYDEFLSLYKAAAYYMLSKYWFMIIALAVLLAKPADPLADLPKLESLRLVEDWVPLEDRILLLFEERILFEFVDPRLTILWEAFYAAIAEVDFICW